MKTLLLFVAIFASLSAEISGATYGEFCDSTKPCRPSSLTCRNDTCTCPLPENDLFDSSRTACVRKVGKICRETQTDRSYRRVNSAVCVKHALCGGNNTCTCDTGYFPTSEGTCEPQKQFLASCTRDIECRTNLLLKCSADNGTCTCDPVVSFYDAQKQTCALLAGSSCQSTLAGCPPLSQCRYDTTKKNGASFNPFQDFRCLCDNNAYQTSGGRCELKKVIGQECTASEECQEPLNLSCVNGTCSCNNNSLFNSTTNKCLSLAGNGCDYFNSKCVEHAQCIWDLQQLPRPDANGATQVNKQICKCNADYYPNEDHLCKEKRGYEEACSKQIPCLSKTWLNLTCSEQGRCQCAGNNTFYDAVHKVCAKLLGSSCHQDWECGFIGRCSGNKCICQNSDDTADPSGTGCIAGHQSRCNDTTAICNAEKGLTCRNGRCECQYFDHQIYDRRVKKCVSFVEGPCDNGTLLSCVPHAICGSVGNLRKNVCRCDKGYVPVDRMCDRGYGESCDYQAYSGPASAEPWCDRLGPLNCVKGSCQCGEFQFYDQSQLKCKGLMGSKCKLSEKDFCGDGAICKGFRGTGFGTKGFGICSCSDGYLEDNDGQCHHQNVTSVKDN